MKHKKEKLLKLLKLIEEISNQPDNYWFKNELSKLFLNAVSVDKSSISSVLESKISLIQKYLSIDIIRIIDYSDFENPSQEQLFRDCLEMCRYQKGTPNHKVNFGEFCRYAHLQAEEMINYFFSKMSNNDIRKIENLIQQKNPGYKPTKAPTDIHHIYYTHKLLAFKNASDMSKRTIDMLWFLNDFRNELSHRNSFSNINEDKELSQYEQAGFINASINFNNLNDKQKVIFNKGKYIITKRKEEYNTVYDTIEDLKKNVIKALSNPIKIQSSKVTIGSVNPILNELKAKLDIESK